ncbi:MAG: GH116 family glycosyl-hydrolase [Phycisphaeraceae bacterium]|nr:GH116 family glycosyl-hydrolase [Phycisphaeraceae bacterium]
MQQTLFPTNLPVLEWTEFAASGFKEPVWGLIHRAARPAVEGMPLGGIDTGCIDLETNGTLGTYSIFTNLLMRYRFNLPFLGLAVGDRAWTLTTNKLHGVQCARDIHYWGHYPIADLEYELDSPVTIGMRAWSPFIPGDVAASSIPAAIFEVHLRNTASAQQGGTVVFSFPGTDGRDLFTGSIWHQALNIGPGFFDGDLVVGYHKGPYEASDEATVVRDLSKVASEDRTHKYQDSGVASGQVEGGSSWILGVLGDEPIRLGGALDDDGPAWANIRKALPPRDHINEGTSVAVDFALDPGEHKVVRFVLAWRCPHWWGCGTYVQRGSKFTHMYAARFAHVAQVVELLIEQHASLLKRILAWQQLLYSERTLPGWLRDTLINLLHVITEVSVWAQAEPPVGDWCRAEDGLFAMNESPRTCPQMECAPCSYQGSLPMALFFPELALSTLRAYKAYQFPDGAVPMVFGGLCGGSEGYEITQPARAYQTTTNGLCFVGMVDRYWRCTGDDAVLREFYPSVKKSTQFTMDLNRGPDGVISMPDRIVSEDVTHETEWIECAEWHGMCSHVGGLHLANVIMAQRMAEAVGDQDFADQCRQWFQQGSRSMEQKMWTGQYYLQSRDAESGDVSELVLSCQLDGDWMAKTHGLPSVFDPARSKIALDTIKRTCLPIAEHGVVLFASPHGQPVPPDKVGYGTYGVIVSQAAMLAMNYMYQDDEEVGLDLCRRMTYNICCRQGSTWDLPAIIKGDTGKRYNGHDYYLYLIFWAIPAALEKQELADLCQPGALIDRIIKAGQVH